MQFKTQLVVLGAKSSKGEFNGRPFDSTTVFYQAELQDGENFAGQVGADFKWGTSANFEKIKNQKFPFMADCVLEQVSNGKTTVTILKELTPVAQPAK
ncbi:MULTISPECIES: hypothetical protein [Acinetobacter]|uniref:Single-stranded DNA-binding protein n=4 Tax=Acinetobacter TaxID=469 RepID=A0A558F951_9GAMM|nr:MULTISPECIES: hypothetical protein [Acinetobacter]ENU91486.1 hypothetical protein F971_02578 [Acinetobacter vivianii]TVT82130.1 hypothetical protein FPV60_09455 [Acinetobacter colistiniresistens]VXA54280.1 conserved hypothetical protein [Acinetobacter proteolyticus]